MKRVPILQEEHVLDPASHPDAKKPLDAFESITALCNDCGHLKVLDRGKLLGLTKVPSFGELWRHAYCSECPPVEPKLRNITLTGVPLGQETPPAPRWSTARVFDGDRSDPNPGLPRRGLFGARHAE